MENPSPTGVGRPDPGCPDPVARAEHAPIVNPSDPVASDSVAASSPEWLAAGQPAPSHWATEPRVSDQQMRMILDVTRLLAVTTDLDALLARIAHITTDMLACERASIFLCDAMKSELWTKVALQSGEIRVPCSAGIVGHAFTHNVIVHVPEPYVDPRFNPEPDRRSGFLTRNLLSAPMSDLDGKPLGVIQAVNKIGRPFSDNDLGLIQLLSDQAGVAIQRHRLQLQTIEILALKHEMDLARKTQQALIPKNPPRLPGMEATGWTLPASTTGGDCFDLWRLPDGRMGIFLADASGHGLAPALIVSQARTLVRAISEMESDPHLLLARVNARLADDLEWGQFVTAFLGFLAPDGLLHWSSAGHGPLFIRPSVGEPMQTLEPPVQPLGVIPRWFDDGPPPVRIGPTGSLILVSDGIFEATNAAGEQLGIERMCELLDHHQHDAPERVLAMLREQVRAWVGQCEPTDDQTIVIVQRTLEPCDGPAGELAEELTESLTEAGIH